MTFYYIAKFYDYEQIHNIKFDTVDKTLLFFKEKYGKSFYKRDDKELSIIGNSGDNLWIAV